MVLMDGFFDEHMRNGVVRQSGKLSHSLLDNLWAYNNLIQWFSKCILQNIGSWQNKVKEKDKINVNDKPSQFL